MTKRDRALAAIRTAAYHGDHRTALQVYVSNRVSRAAYNEAWAAGRRAKERGVRCSCPTCNGPT